MGHVCIPIKQFYLAFYNPERMYFSLYSGECVGLLSLSLLQDPDTGTSSEQPSRHGLSQPHCSTGCTVGLGSAVA